MSLSCPSSSDCSNLPTPLVLLACSIPTTGTPLPQALPQAAALGPRAAPTTAQYKTATKTTRSLARFKTLGHQKAITRAQSLHPLPAHSEKLLSSQATKLAMMYRLLLPALQAPLLAKLSITTITILTLLAAHLRQ
jgi:hypothetical protein